MILIALVIKLFWMLLSTATEAEIRVTVVHDSFVRTGHLSRPQPEAWLQP